MKVIKFAENEYITDSIIKENNVIKSGFIATKEQYSKGYCSYAHLYEDGNIRRYGKKIGSLKDITVIGDCDVSPDYDVAVLNLATHPSWRI